MVEEELLSRLLQACKKNDRKAQKQLYEMYYGPLMSLCLRYAGNRDEALQILNDSYFKVFSKLEEYSSEKGNFFSWIYRIAINTAIDFTRSKIKHISLEDIQYVPDVGLTFDFLSPLGVEEILEMVQQLSPAYRTVFNLYVLEEYSHEEIATMLQINVGTSKSNLFKAKQRLKELIKEHQNYNALKVN